MKKKEIKIKVEGYLFTIKFVNTDKENYDGITWNRTRVIEIRDDLDDEATMLLIRHELVHAILTCQGRIYQKKFDVEEVCEFVAYKLPKINEICNTIKRLLEVEE